MSQQLPGLLFLIPFFAAVCMPLLGLFNPKSCRPVALSVLAIMTVLSLIAYAVVLSEGPVRYYFAGWSPPIGIEWVLDGLSGIVMPLLSTLALIAVIYAGPTTAHAIGRGAAQFYSLVLLLVSGLTGIVLAADLFNIFVFLEMASLCSYALVGSAGGPALISAFRYLILGTIGASFYLLGVGYFYAVSGTLNMVDLAERLPDIFTSKAAMAGLIFIFVGLAIKMALIPLHGWLPDAYAYAPDSVSPLIAPLVTKVALYAVVRILYWVLGAATIIGEIPIAVFISWIGALGAVIGAFLALSQENLKRMFAYGGISHVGLTLIGLTLGNQTGFAGGVFYMLNDAVMQATLFFIAGSAFYRFGIRDLSQLVHIRGHMPWTITALIVVAFSMIGIPPMGGFFGKWYIILGALEARNYVAIAAVLASTLLTLAYFMKVFERVFLAKESTSFSPGLETPRSMRLCLGVVAATMILLGVLSDRVMTMILESAIPAGLSVSKALSASATGF